MTFIWIQFDSVICKTLSQLSCKSIKMPDMFCLAEAGLSSAQTVQCIVFNIKNMSEYV